MLSSRAAVLPDPRIEEGNAMLPGRAANALPPREITSISNYQNMHDVETYVAKVRKDLLAESVKQRLEDQN